MKKYIALLLALCLLLAGGQRAFAQSASEEATEETLPKTTEVKVMGDRVPVIRLLLSEADTVEITGYEGRFAQVKAGQEEGQVPTRLLRFPDEPFEGWTAYALWDSCLYPNFACLGAPQERLSINTRLEVLEDLDGCLYVRVGEETGFVPDSKLSRYPYQPPTQEAAPSPQDGGNITLMQASYSLRLLADTVKTGPAQVKIDGVPLVIRWCDYGDTVQVCEPDAAPELPNLTPILEADGSLAYIPTLWLESAKEDFTPWESYAGGACQLYDNLILAGKEAKTVYANRQLTVLWDTGVVAFVQLDDTGYYTASAALRTTPVPTAPGGSGGSSSGSSGDLWTPPIL